MLTCLFFLVFQLDADAKAHFLEALRQLGDFSASFQQETYSDFFDETRAAGVIDVQRPGKLRMEYRQGEKRLIVWDGKTCYERDAIADSESRSEQSEWSGEPLVRILLYGDQLEQHYLIDRKNSETGMLFRLRPRNGDGYQVFIGLDQSWTPKSLEVRKNDGEGTRFLFSSVTFRPKRAVNAFVVPAK